MTPEEVANKIIEYESNGEKVKLSQAIIKRYLVSGDAAAVTDAETMIFLKTCEYQHLNPFLREAYLIKYGNNPATMVMGKGAYEKRAARSKLYGGFEAGVIVADSKGKLTQRVGALVLGGETLVGGWAKVHVKGYNVPMESAVAFDEYVGRRKDGTPNEQWQKKPATMIRKVALVQALREAFPEELEGLPYAAEELAGGEPQAAELPPDELPPIEIPKSEPYESARPEAAMPNDPF